MLRPHLAQLVRLLLLADLKQFIEKFRQRMSRCLEAMICVHIYNYIYIEIDDPRELRIWVFSGAS